MKNKKVKDPLKLMRWMDDGSPPINFQDELQSILALIHEVRLSPVLSPNQLTMTTSQEVHVWINEPIWITYAMDKRLEKKLQISVGKIGFRVLHGKEIIYEGGSMGSAIEKYNDIITVPDPRLAPKTNK